MPILWREDTEDGNPWGLRFLAMFHMSGDSALFRSRDQLEKDGFRLDGNVFARRKERYLPLYEAKMVHHYDHRFGDYAGRSANSEGTALPAVSLENKRDPDFRPLPRYWVSDSQVQSRLADKWSHGWLLGWRDICRSTDYRTVISAIMPRHAIGNKIPLALPDVTPGSPPVSTGPSTPWRWTIAPGRRSPARR